MNVVGNERMLGIDDMSISPVHMPIPVRHSSESSAGTKSQDRPYKPYEDDASPTSYTNGVISPLAVFPTEHHRMLPPLPTMVGDVGRRPLDMGIEQRTSGHRGIRSDLLDH